MSVMASCPGTKRPVANLPSLIRRLSREETSVIPPLTTRLSGRSTHFKGKGSHHGGNQRDNVSQARLDRKEHVMPGQCN